MNLNYKHISLSCIAGLVMMIYFSCYKEVAIEPGNGYDDWTSQTHSNDAEANYSIVFAEDKVHRLDIVIDADNWEIMQEDLEDMYGDQNNQGPNNQPPPNKSLKNDPGNFSDENPVYVPCQVYYNDKRWYDVGIRYKGNSSLKSAYSQGVAKLPFRLEFNHFEDENPLIWGQTFYGFQQLSFSSGFKDNSLLREKITSDLFREYNIPVARTAFYRIYIDYGDGPVYFGLYTMVEVIFDTMIREQFGETIGSCYKPDSDGAYLNDVNAISDVNMANKTYEGVYDEAINLINALTSQDRTTAPDTWRQNLEEVMDMEEYLKYLASNTTIANWDTYGKMTHNYYLYANPADGKLVWIPWDNNESLTTTGSMTALDFDFSNLENDNPTSDNHTWPMILYVYNNNVYKSLYESCIDDFISSVFTETNVHSKIDTYSDLIEEFVIGNNGEQEGYTFLNSTADWQNGVDEIRQYIITRRVEAANYTP